MRGATQWQSMNFRCKQYFNPRSSCEERLHPDNVPVFFHYFNPRSSCEERHYPLGWPRRCGHISIHAPHARSDLTSRQVWPCQRISIHAPHARSDGHGGAFGCTNVDFNPRSSCEERREIALSVFVLLVISIHAPHARSDPTIANVLPLPSYFNPRSSCEERPQNDSAIKTMVLFQSTLLMRGATTGLKNLGVDVSFQSTLLMRGATRCPVNVVAVTLLFQSTLLMRGATGASGD